MILYVVRHGQTEANKNHLFNGINEGDLTNKGIEQAKELIPFIKNINIDRIFSSPLRRTVHTAELLNINNKEIFKDERLIERDCGKYTLEPTNLIKDKSKLYSLENTYTEFESFQSIIDRTKNFIEEIKTKYIDENILVVTHGDVIIGFQKYFNIKSTEYPKTCELIKFEIK